MNETEEDILESPQPCGHSECECCQYRRQQMDSISKGIRDGTEQLRRELRIAQEVIEWCGPEVVERFELEKVKALVALQPPP